MSKIPRRHLGAFVGVAIAILFSAAILAQVVRGEDAEPDSYFIAEGPIMDPQTWTQKYEEGVALEQQAELDHQNAIAGLYGPPPPKVPEQREPVPPAAPLVPAILEDFNIPPGWGNIYSLENKWHGMVNNERVFVYAGLKYDEFGRFTFTNPAQGALIVLAFPSNPDTEPNSQEYLTPTRTGAVRVTSYSGLCLTLTSTSSTNYQFNVATRQWSCQVNHRPPPP